MIELQQVFLILIRTLVDDSNAVEVLPTTDKTGMTIFTVKVAKPDVGKLIGSQGRTARSLRIILSAAAMKYSQRFGLDIIDS